MKAVVEVYEDRKGIIRIIQDNGALIDQYDVSEIAVELPKGYIETVNPEGSIKVNSRKNR